MKTLILLCILVTGLTYARPVEQMNRAFEALTELIPFLTNETNFQNKANGPVIEKKISELYSAFQAAKHEPILKGDLFAPSYQVINQNLKESLDAFKKGNKDYAHWRLREVTTQCMDCHTRLPPSHVSSFQNGRLAINESKFNNIYDLGIAQLIVRRYVDAKSSFTRDIQDRLIRKDLEEIDLPFKQILLIGAKVLKEPENLVAFFQSYQKNEKIPETMRLIIKSWMTDLNEWKGNKYLVKGLKHDSDVERFIKEELKPLESEELFDGTRDVPLLISSGLLSNYLFENPETKLAPEISYWLGWSEKYLNRERFFGSSDLFLRQCIKKYPSHPVAARCLESYKESVEFEFSGSGGKNVPKDVQNELKALEKLIKQLK